VERPYEFCRIEKVVEFVLIEHLVQFPDSGIEPSRDPDHGTSENAVLRWHSELARDELNELLSGRRIGGGRDVPSLVPGVFAVRQQNQDPRLHRVSYRTATRKHAVFHFGGPAPAC
jgi:hypothetical protein